MEKSPRHQWSAWLLIFTVVLTVAEGAPSTTTVTLPAPPTADSSTDMLNDSPVQETQRTPPEPTGYRITFFKVSMSQTSLQSMHCRARATVLHCAHALAMQHVCNVYETLIDVMYVSFCRILNAHCIKKAKEALKYRQRVSSVAYENLIYLQVQAVVFDSGLQQDASDTTVSALQHVKNTDKKERCPTTKWTLSTSAIEYLNVFEHEKHVQHSTLILQLHQSTHHPMKSSCKRKNSNHLAHAQSALKPHTTLVHIIHFAVHPANSITMQF